MPLTRVIGYEYVTVILKIPPGQIVQLPLKTCMNNPFLNICNDNLYFEPKTKHEFIGLIEYLPNLVFDAFQIKCNSHDEEKLFEDYKFIYKGIYNHLVFNEGFITPEFHKFNTLNFRNISDIWKEFFNLLVIFIKEFKIDSIQELTTSPVQFVLFNCMFSDLKNTFFF